jgi:Bacterial Ig-like domain (group 3)/Bacterial Ig-like domain (group 2)
MRPRGLMSSSVFVLSLLFSFLHAGQAQETAGPQLISTKTTLTSLPNPSTYGQNVKLTATVTPSGVTGTVTFKDTINGTTTTLGTVTLVNGVAIGFTNKLIAGSHTITATYNGNSTYGTSSATLTQTVKKANTTTTVTSSPNPSSYNQPVTFTATVTGQYGGAVTGTATFTYGTRTLCNAVPLVGGVATCSSSTLPVGSDSVTAAYGGDSNNNSSSGSGTQTVNKAATTTTVTASPNPSSYKQSVTITATVTGAYGGTPTGTATFTYGTTTLCSAVTLASGVATCAYAGLPVGSDTITASYSGDGNYLGSSGTVIETVNPASTTTTLTSSPNPSSYNQSVTLTATVTPTPDGGTVTFKSGSTTLCNAVALTGGVATCPGLTFAVGSTVLTANYSGDTDYASSSGSDTQTVNKASTTTTVRSSLNPSNFNQQVTFTATVTGAFGGTPTGTATFTYGSTTLCNAVSLSSGVATCNYSTLPAGSDTVTVTYNGDGNYLGSSGTVVQTVNALSTTTTLTSAPNPSNYLIQSVTFTATVAPAPDGGTVTFTYNGSPLCSAVALSSGVATCSYSNLPVGSDLVTAAYSGDGNYTASSGSVTQTVNHVLLSIAVSPQGLSVAALATQQYTAEGTYNDNTHSDITQLVTWSSSNTSAATIIANGSSGGLATAGNPTSTTSTTITATLAPGTPGTSTLTVYPSSTFFVAPPCALQPCPSVYGSDAWNGDLSEPNAAGTDGPFASVSRAQYAVENAAKPATVYLRAGTYYPATTPAVTGSSYSGTLTFTSADSGASASAPVTWTEYPSDIGTPAVISGGVPVTKDPTSGVGLNLTWTNSGNWYKATLPLNLPGSSIALQPFESLYYNGERRLRSRIHDTGTSNGTNTEAVGYYMTDPGGTPTCNAIAGWPAGEYPLNLESCNLGSFLRVANTIPYSTTQGQLGYNCPYTTGVVQNVTVTKCLDRFIYTQSTGTGADTIDNWSNLTTTAGVPNQPCTQTTNYPAGDVGLTLFDAWTVDAMRVNCVDTTNHVIYLVGYTKSGGSMNNSNVNSNYNFFGPLINHRFIIENSYDVFTAAQAAGQVGIWFLDRSQGAGKWVLNYIANTSNNENPANDYVVIPQLPLTGAQFPQTSGSTELNDFAGGSLISATGLQYVTFSNIGFEVDNFYPSLTTGFNNDTNGEMPVPQAIDCENCQGVTFSGVTVRHTSASGILAASTTAPTPCSNGSQPTSTSFCVLIENSSFYDVGDSGIRIGHYALNADTSANAVQDVLVQNNLVQGFSRVLADGEGITEGNGFNNEILNNTVTDGYHAGISICNNGCGRGSQYPNNQNGNNVYANNNLLSNLMQGITSDGGSLYFNVGGTASATGDQIYGNVVYNTTDSYIIDIGNGITSNPGTAYGGEGIYLDKQTADVDVENNLVFNVDGHAIHLTEGLASPSETPNKFAYNIFAFASEGMLMQGQPWQTGCPNSTQTQVQQVQVLDNLFVFDVQTGTTKAGAPFSVIQGCTDSCISASHAASYTDYQLFQGNDYWSYAETFTGVSNAYKILKNQGAGPGGVFQQSDGSWSCANTTGTNYDSLYFDQSANNWQTGSVPVAMMEDANGASVDPTTGNSSFPTSGSSGNVKSQFTINNYAGLGTFNPNGANGTSGTNAAITNAGAPASVPGPPATCSTVQTTAVTVCPTFPTYVFTSF